MFRLHGCEVWPCSRTFPGDLRCSVHDLIFFISYILTASQCCVSHNERMGTSQHFEAKWADKELIFFWFSMENRVMICHVNYPFSMKYQTLFFGKNMTNTSNCCLLTFWLSVQCVKYVMCFEFQRYREVSVSLKRVLTFVTFISVTSLKNCHMPYHSS